MSQVLLQQVDGVYDVSGEITRSYHTELIVSSRCSGLEIVGLHRCDVDHALRGVRPQHVRSLFRRAWATHRWEDRPTCDPDPVSLRESSSPPEMSLLRAEVSGCTGRPRR